jgi:hypothetical protein
MNVGCKGLRMIIFENNLVVVVLVMDLILVVSCVADDATDCIVCHF